MCRLHHHAILEWLLQVGAKEKTHG
ncbi:unnamed protein product [Victoria cruziana]